MDKTCEPQGCFKQNKKSKQTYDQKKTVEIPVTRNEERRHSENIGENGNQGNSE